MKPSRQSSQYVVQQLIILLLIVLAACLLFAVGLMVGYGVIGDGDSMWSILSPAKWQELIGKFTGK
ncbi:DNA-directed RNA polymerase subunit beta [Streptococcus ovuberis]|uniref:DNA-directed RNA polymerase subunit beta n=1 Tax=Streptococcus ovuberis TaxID=1936207 RepID=A0A7X6N0X5_9STRE|nr:DNA-directed RNA polymerase subunit beta [Streptococcus ovuberis]NKZ20034.1 DNA-directed RNA polymerase subunit beta [Streptococcus ovuberis]